MVIRVGVRLLVLCGISMVAVAACTTTEVRKVSGASSGSVEEEDAGVDEDGGVDPYADGGSLSDSQPKPKAFPVPTMFKRTLDCTTGACSGGTCSSNQGVNCSLVSPCRGKESALKITSLSDFPLLIKTPKVTAADPGCGKLCGASDPTVYAISVQIKTPIGNEPIAIKVPPPWRVSVGDDRYGPIYCATGGDPVPSFANKDCVAYYGSGNGTFAIVTSDPAAPSVNVSVELLPASSWPTQFDGQCPY